MVKHDADEKYITNKLKIEFIRFGLNLVNNDAEFQQILLDAAKIHGIDGFEVLIKTGLRMKIQKNSLDELSPLKI